MHALLSIGATLGASSYAGRPAWNEALGEQAKAPRAEAVINIRVDKSKLLDSFAAAVEHARQHRPGGGGAA